MKLYAILTLILFLTMLFVPLFSLLGKTQSTNAPAVSQSSTAEQTSEQSEKTTGAETEAGTQKQTNAEESTSAAKISGDKIAVLRASSGKVENVGLHGYVVCCVACEMPYSYNEEALKAQAVVSYTYALYQMKSGNEKSDISDDPSVHQAYKSYDELKEKWGGDYEKYIAKYEKAVSAVEGSYLTYGGELIKPPYFAMSSGMTNSAEDVWGVRTDWLVSVSSDSDKLSPSVRSTFEFSEKELIKCLSDYKIKEISIGIPELSASGYVKSIEISSNKFSGDQLRQLLSLRSGNFTVEKSGDLYVFNCMGYGHGVGMSQYGANAMAKLGSSYKEILSHYYPGTQLSE
ncbi:MAG: stage II sporulation protein D [Acutalibacteraceae bacterium]|nr:stage II sporulation protein D [Oscillospiraceae bacterium]